MFPMPVPSRQSRQGSIIMRHGETPPVTPDRNRHPQIYAWCATVDEESGGESVPQRTSSQPSQRVFHPDSPTGRVSVRETGDVAMTLSFPAGLAAFSRVSIEFTPQGTRIFGPSFEVHNEHAPSPSRTNRSRGARINVQPSANSTPSRRTPIIVEAHDLPENNALTHAVELLAVVDEPIVEQSVVDSSDSDSDNEPEVMPAAFTLDDIPDPVYPRVGRQKGPREPLPMNPTGAESYWVVLRGFKIGIFLEAWSDIEKWTKNYGGHWRKAMNYNHAKNIWAESAHQVIPIS